MSRGLLVTGLLLTVGGAMSRGLLTRLQPVYPQLQITDHGILGTGSAPVRGTRQQITAYVTIIPPDRPAIDLHSTSRVSSTFTTSGTAYHQFLVTGTISLDDQHLQQFTVALQGELLATPTRSYMRLTTSRLTSSGVYYGHAKVATALLHLYTDRRIAFPTTTKRTDPLFWMHHLSGGSLSSVTLDQHRYQLFHQSTGTLLAVNGELMTQPIHQTIPTTPERSILLERLVQQIRLADSN